MLPLKDDTFSICFGCGTRVFLLLLKNLVTEDRGEKQEFYHVLYRIIYFNHEVATVYKCSALDSPYANTRMPINSINDQIACLQSKCL